ncbi:MAG TPA: ABC transporter substrate-binding protein [Thermodesulfobacteriota bacterium]|nr:ABC transporter substrate-binding protein [Thermodesulfobacteriota bacterium]
MKRVCLFVFLFLAVPRLEPLPPVSAQPAIDVVENLHETLLLVMKEGNQIGYQGRYDRLAPVITAGFDMPFIAKIVLGRFWEIFGSEQKSKFVETFSRLSIATYAANFDTYSGERFKLISEKEVSGGRVLVQTRLIKSDGGQVELDYLLHRVGSQWRIINVVSDGVSDLALKRADYTTFLKSNGLDSLLIKLNEKIVQYSN